MSDRTPPGSSEAAHDAAHSPAPGYEEFCEEFAEGGDGATWETAKLWATANGFRIYHYTTTNAVAVLLGDAATPLPDLCDALSIRRHYDAALEAAWRDHQEAGV